jgi:hypothetical protein
VPPVLKSTIGLFFKPSARIESLPRAGTAKVAVRWALVGLEMTAEVVDGRLALTPDGERAGMLDEVYDGVDGWLKNLNDWLAQNGHGLAPLEVGSNRIVLRKVALQ